MLHTREEYMDKICLNYWVFGAIFELLNYYLSDFVDMVTLYQKIAFVMFIKMFISHEQ